MGCLNCEVVERVNEFTVCTPIRAREDETPSFAVTVGFATAEIHNNIGDLREGANVVPNVGGGQSKSSSGDEGNRVERVHGESVCRNSINATTHRIKGC